MSYQKVRKLMIFLMLLLICNTILAQSTLTPEEKKRKQYEKAVNYLQVAQKLDSIEIERKKHKYLIVYDGWIFEDELSTIDPAKVCSIEMKQGSSSIVPCDYVVIIITTAARLRETNRRKRIQLYSGNRKSSKNYGKD